MYVRRVRGPAQVCVFPCRENGRQPILASVCGRATPLLRSVRQSRTSATHQRIHGRAVINIDARKCGQRPHLRATVVLYIIINMTHSKR